LNVCGAWERRLCAALHYSSGGNCSAPNINGSYEVLYITAKPFMQNGELLM